MSAGRVGSMCLRRGHRPILCHRSTCLFPQPTCPCHPTCLCRHSPCPWQHRRTHPCKCHPGLCCCRHSQPCHRRKPRPCRYSMCLCRHPTCPCRRHPCHSHRNSSQSRIHRWTPPHSRLAPSHIRRVLRHSHLVTCQSQWGPFRSYQAPCQQPPYSGQHCSCPDHRHLPCPCHRHPLHQACPPCLHPYSCHHLLLPCNQCSWPHQERPHYLCPLPCCQRWFQPCPCWPCP
mmetsp:Transcript_80329/g.260219  ORF Transcript_80329/g.260219 Transcript_80329/m.260219 type:complete len:230 (-) Transcript_80329:463-1152(-)